MSKGVKGFFKNLASAPVEAAGKAINEGIDQTVTNLEEAQEKLNERLKIQTEGHLLQKIQRPIIVFWFLLVLTLAAYQVITPEQWFLELVSEGFKMVILTSRAFVRCKLSSLCLRGNSREILERRFEIWNETTRGE